MARKPQTSTEAGLAAMKKEHALQRLEEKLASGWIAPAPKEKKKVLTRVPDLLEERTAQGIQLTIFHAIATVDGTVRAQELQRFDASHAQGPGRRPKQAKKARPPAATQTRSGAETKEEEANKAWAASALG